MKKFVAIFLAVAMILGCVSSFAYLGELGTFGNDSSFIGLSYNDDTGPTGCVRDDGTNSRGLPSEDAIFFNKGTEDDVNLAVKVTGSTYLSGDNLKDIDELDDDNINLVAQVDLKFVQDAKFCGVVMDSTENAEYQSTQTTTPIRSDDKYILASGYGFSLREGNIIDIFINASYSGTVDNAEINLADFAIDSSEYNTYAIYRTLDEKAYFAVNNILVSVIDLATGFIYDAEEENVLAEGNDDKYNVHGAPFFCVVGDGSTEVYFDNIGQNQFTELPTFDKAHSKFENVSVDIAAEKYTVNVTLRLIAGDNLGDFTVRGGDTEFEIAGKTQTISAGGVVSTTFVATGFKSPALLLNKLAATYDLELYKGDELIDTVEAFSVKDYLEEVDDQVAADVLSLASALDVFSGGEGFAVAGASEPVSLPQRESTMYATSTNPADRVGAATLVIDEDVNIAFLVDVDKATKARISMPDVAGFAPVEVNDISSGRVETPDIQLAALDSVYAIEMLDDDDNVIASAEYSPMDYIYYAYNGNNTEVANVCRALYAINADLNPAT